LATASGSASLNTGKSVDETLIPQAVVDRTTAEQNSRVAPVAAKEANATRTGPERDNMLRPPYFAGSLRLRLLNPGVAQLGQSRKIRGEGE
jgi:hypothetical protein